MAESEGMAQERSAQRERCYGSRMGKACSRRVVPGSTMYFWFVVQCIFGLLWQVVIAVDAVDSDVVAMASGHSGVALLPLARSWHPLVPGARPSTLPSTAMERSVHPTSAHTAELGLSLIHI